MGYWDEVTGNMGHMGHMWLVWQCVLGKHGPHLPIGMWLVFPTLR
jgi:hypothetical protein